eukprot:gene2354-2581_t
MASSSYSSSKRNDKGNPNFMIQNQLQLLRTEREKVISDIFALEEERKAILDTLPKVYHELLKLRESLSHAEEEQRLFQHAIREIEKNYGDYLFSPEFFADHD